MQINTPSLNATFIAFNKLYQDAFTAVVPLWQNVAMTVSSNTRMNTYAWMDRLPKMVEWIGERKVQNLKNRAYTLANKKYESTVEIDRDDFEDDQLGVYTPTLMMMGQGAALHYDDITFDLLKAGASTACHDGQNFFDLNHPVEQADGSTTLTYPNLFIAMPLTAANVAILRANMRSWLGADGRPLGITPNLLVVPPQLEIAARTIVASNLIANAAGTAAASNVLQGIVDVLVVPQLADRPLEWYLMATTGAIKPLVLQVRKAPRFAYLNSETDENVFWRNKYVYGVDSRDAAGFGLWFLALKAVG